MVSFRIKPLNYHHRIIFFCLYNANFTRRKCNNTAIGAFYLERDYIIKEIS